MTAPVDYGSWQALTKAQAVEQRMNQVTAGLSNGWATIALTSGWGAESLNTPRAKILPNNLVFIRGGIILPSAGSYNAVQFGGVGAGYIPTNVARWAAVPISGITYGNASFPGSPRVFLDTSGILTLLGIPGSLNSTTVDISGWYATD